MKIGTDAVLLGAWVSLEMHPEKILDIGAGTGVIALQLAQRCYATQIDALEIDSNAFEQCVHNFENAPWSDRLFCYHASLQQFVEEIDEQYDVIVSNPPFYETDFFSKDQQRNTARFTSALSFEMLLQATSKLLSKKGEASFIIPKESEEKFIAIAAQYNLFPRRITHVKGSPKRSVKRSLLSFSFQKQEVLLNALIIEISRHQYTTDYIDLVKDFYLKM